MSKFNGVHHRAGQLLPVLPIQVREFGHVALPISVWAAISKHGMAVPWARGACAAQGRGVALAGLVFCSLYSRGRHVHTGALMRLGKLCLMPRDFDDAKSASGLFPKFGCTLGAVGLLLSYRARLGPNPTCFVMRPREWGRRWPPTCLL